MVVLGGPVESEWLQVRVRIVRSWISGGDERERLQRRAMRISVLKRLDDCGSTAT